jgi:4'-phosphopantetheinyl transferase
MRLSLPTATVALPAAGQVHLWLLEAPVELSDKQQQRYAAWLNPEEQERWQRFRFGADQQRFLLARALVRSVLAGYLQQAPAAVQFTRTAHGKPELHPQSQNRFNQQDQPKFPRQPLAPLHFNLSHTHGLLVLAVTTGAEVGVDVEAMTREVEILALAERFFAPTEVALLRQCSGEHSERSTHQRELFFRLWTLKEAYVKALGRGLSVGLDTFAFDFNAAGVPILSVLGAAVATCDESRPWSFLQLQHRQFSIAVAVHAAELSAAQLTQYWPEF